MRIITLYPALHIERRVYSCIYKNVFIGKSQTALSWKLPTHTHIYALIYWYQHVFKTPHIKTSCVLYSKPYTTDFLLSITVFKTIHIRQTGQYWKLHILSNPWSVFKLHTFSEILWSVFKITHIIILTVVCIQNSCTLRGNAVCLPNHLYISDLFCIQRLYSYCQAMLPALKHTL